MCKYINLNNILKNLGLGDVFKNDPELFYYIKEKTISINNDDTDIFISKLINIINDVERSDYLIDISDINSNDKIVIVLKNDKGYEYSHISDGKLILYETIFNIDELNDIIFKNKSFKSNIKLYRYSDINDLIKELNFIYGINNNYMNKIIKSIEYDDIKGMKNDEFLIFLNKGDEYNGKDS